MAIMAFRRRGGLRSTPCFIVNYREFVKQFNFLLPEDAIELIGGTGGFCIHDVLLGGLPAKLGYRKKRKIIFGTMKNNNISRRGLAIMGVYHNPNLRGKQWVCTLTINKVKAISTHETEAEARKRLSELHYKADYDVFIEEFKRDPIVNIRFGSCMVDEGEEGERCSRGVSCSRYMHCLKEAAKLDMQGWRIHDTDRT